jgi:NADPH:quinone reductase
MLAIINTPDADSETRRDDITAPIPGPGQVLLDVEAFSLNRGELDLMTARPEGWRPGQDVAGRVSVPSDGCGPPAGTRVVAAVPGGGWAQQVVADIIDLTELPDNVPAIDAATLPVAALTALRATRARGDLLGRNVLVTGASGAVGSFAIQLCVARGARVAALASERHATRLLKLGAKQVADDLTEIDENFDLVLDTVGGTTLDGALERTAPDANVVLVGNSTGEAARLDVFRFVGGHERVSIEPYLSYAHPDPASEDLRLLVQLLADGRLKAPIARVEDWSNLDTVIDDLRERRFSGKAVFTLG